ncbi:MAG: hypothetical protein ACRDKJ_03560 [Actinomycetota bacterium]
MKTSERRFVVCIQAEAGIDLELHKVYEVLPDESATAENLVRVIDESGEDYLYPSSFFVPIDLTDDSARALRASVQSRPRATG